MTFKTLKLVVKVAVWWKFSKTFLRTLT